MKGCIIYGGSFNPVHIGHLRLALEASWMLASMASNLEFVPTARHPQKDSRHLLPLSLRMEMINACIKKQPNMRCNGLEGERTAVSYTCDTVKEYLQKWQGNNIYFLLGSKDYELFDSWYKWREIARLCNLAVMPRGNFLPLKFAETTRLLWPWAEESPIPPELALKNRAIQRMSISENTFAYYLPARWLPVSSSWIRELWLENRNPLWLMPAEALEILLENSEIVDSCWGKPADKG